jgi:hypothetical protein
MDKEAYEILRVRSGVNRLLINGGIKWVTVGPAVAKILAKANLV